MSFFLWKVLYSEGLGACVLYGEGSFIQRSYEHVSCVLYSEVLGACVLYGEGSFIQRS